MASIDSASGPTRASGFILANDNPAPRSEALGGGAVDSVPWFEPQATGRQTGTNEFDFAHLDRFSSEVVDALDHVVALLLALPCSFGLSADIGDTWLAGMLNDAVGVAELKRLVRVARNRPAAFVQ